MPRKAIPLPYRVEYLSILDEKGHLDRELEPDIPAELLLKIHRGMLVTRRLDERMLALQRQGRIGTFPLVTGHEAAHVGAIPLLRPEDWLVPAYREIGAEIWRGRLMENVMLYYAGFEEGAAIEEGRNDLPIAVPIGSQTLHAVGIALAIRHRRDEKVVLTFLGEGATSEGDFHEAMNFAGVFQVPLVFVCQNNQWAISVPRSRQTHSETLAQKAIAYGMPSLQVDGNDVLAVYSATREAVDRARSGGGPTFIECITYRLAQHTTSDDPKRYRSDAEVEEWAKRDPIPRFQTYLAGKGLLSEEGIQRVEDEVRAEIQGAVDRFEARAKELGDPLHMFEHTLAEPTPTMMEHRAELERELALNAAEQAAEGTAAGIVTHIFRKRPPTAAVSDEGEDLRLAAG